MTGSPDDVDAGDVDDEPVEEFAELPIGQAFSLAVFWALASTATAFAYSWGFGYLYFELLGVALWTSAALLAYHYRDEIAASLAELRESWEKSGEPVDPDAVIDDVVDDGDGGGSA